MYIRLSFESGQKIDKEVLGLLSATLSDDIDFTNLYLKDDGRISQMYYNETDDPKNPKLLEPDAKTKLVQKTNFVELNSAKEYMADFELFMVKHPDLKIKVRGMPKTVTKDYANIIEEIYAIQNKFEDALKSFNNQVEFNQKCEVHVSNLGLLHINQVGYAVDYCTEELQDLLNTGWRIIACCVQPDGRRPDYILGKYNPEETSVKCLKF
jgi:hypothetical protein